MQSLGRIVYDRPGFHSKNAIVPVGYSASRSFWSADGANARELYTLQVFIASLYHKMIVDNCFQVVDGGDTPRYAISGTHVQLEHESLDGIICAHPCDILLTRLWPDAFNMFISAVHEAHPDRFAVGDFDGFTRSTSIFHGDIIFNSAANVWSFCSSCRSRHRVHARLNKVFHLLSGEAPLISSRQVPRIPVQAPNSV